MANRSKVVPRPQSALGIVFGFFDFSCNVVIMPHTHWVGLLIGALTSIMLREKCQSMVTKFLKIG